MKSRFPLLTPNRESLTVPATHSDLRQAQIAIAYRYAPLYMASGAVNATILVIVLWGLVSQPLLIFWYAANLMVGFVRFILAYLFRAQLTTRGKSLRWDLLLTLGLVVNGGIWGTAGIFLFPQNSIPHQVFLAFVLGGMVTGAIGAYAAVLEGALLYAFLALTPITLRFLLQGSSIHFTMGVMLVLFTTMVWLTAKKMNLNIVNALKLRFENQDLLDFLASSKKEAEDLNANLQTEIAGRQVAMEALAESEKKLERILQATPAAAFVLDREHRVIHWNAALESLSGVPSQEAIGNRNPWRAFYSEERPCLANLLLDDKVDEIGKWYPGKCRPSALIPDAYEAIDFFPHLGQDGLWLRFTAAKIRDSAAQTLGVIETLEDITASRESQERLQKSEEYLRALIENASDYILLLDEHGIIQYASPAVERDSGYTQEEICGQNIFVLIHPDDLIQAVMTFQDLLETPENSVHREIRAFAKDRSCFTFEIKARNLLHHPGIKGIVVNTWDVTKHKKTLAALHEAEKNYRDIFENVPLGLYRSSPQGNLLEANPALVQMFACSSREEFLKTPLAHIYARAEDRQRWQDLIEREGMIRNHVVQFVRRDGKTFWAKNSARSRRDENDRVLYYEGVIEDINERKQKDDQLRNSEKRLRDLVENSLTAIFILQEDRIVYHNSEMSRIRGPKFPVYPVSHFSNVHPEDVEKLGDIYQDLLAGKISQGEIDLRLVPTEGDEKGAGYRWYHVRGSAIEYNDKPAILVNLMDITKTMELERLAMVNDKMTSLGRIAAGIIHELRSPLSGINVYLTTLKKMFDGPGFQKVENRGKAEDVIQKLQSASNKIEAVIKRVMDFAKPGCSQLLLTDLNQSLEEAAGLSMATLRKNGIRVEKALDSKIPPCYANAHQIEQVILNLINNAVEAMKNLRGEKRIELSSWSNENWICLGVADSGPGVPPPLQKRIFDPFFTTKSEGVGIGLSLCHRIVADHGGAISVHTGKWGGAEFRVQIPIEKRRNTR